MSVPHIDFKPSKKQFEALEHLLDYETDFVGYGGSAFSGKSYLLCYWLTIMCFAYPGTGYGLGRKELTTLKKTTLITLFKVFDECGVLPDVHFTYNQQLNVITFTNGSQIFLIDTAYKPSDPLYTRLGGYELTSCAVDESAETDLMAIEILSSRTGRRLNNKYSIKAKMLETFNPAKNHVYMRYYRPWKEGKIANTVKFVKALPKDNPSPEVDDYVKKMIDTASKITIERLIYGNFEFDDDPATLIEYESILDCFTNEFVSSGTRYITADIARFGNDSTLIAVWDGLRVKMFQYFKQSLTQTAEVIREFQRKFNVPTSNVIVDEDGVGGGVMDILKCKGFVNNSSALPNPDAPYNEKGEKPKENYANLKSQCYYRLAERINKGELFIDCPDVEMRAKIIQELEQVKQHNMDKDGKKQVLPKDKVKEIIGRSPDFSDALMMRMYFDLKPKRELIWA